MNLDLPKIEEKVLKFWQKNKIFKKLQNKNRGKKRWSFLDGPITANNPMGVHHAWGRTYKDLFQRYKAMQGFDQRFQNGFDCQGLWVEVEVEKELGFNTKKDIENYSIEKFIEKCKERVKKYSKIQTRQSIRLGQWMDWGDWKNALGNSYYTMSDENNYAIWAFLKKCQEKGYLYKGRDVVPWCWRCGAAISQHEILSEEYQEVAHKAIFLKIPVLGEENTFFLVWTTTPWTLPANVSLAVHPELVYVEIQDQKGEIFIVLKKRADLVPSGKIIKEFFGKELQDLKYQGIFNELSIVQQSLKDYEHSVILWKDISEEEGTGIVHIAPGCGQEDFKLSKELNLPVIDPVDDEGKYKEGFGNLTGKSVTKINEIIFENLTQKHLVFKIEDYSHRYPFCWRCKSELIFRLVDEWYIAMEKLREPLMEIAKKIRWIPSFGLERELDWLKNMRDWLISKKRYWGLTLPIYECEQCKNFEVIGSKEELKEKAVAGWEKFEGHSPHRPHADEVKIKCSKCGQAISRIPDVGNPWLDAGIVSFSTMGYFTDREYWQKWFPSDFICESFPGQFKNWFYSLIVMSAVLENTNPVKTIFGHALVHDEKDEEMHKSKGNAIWFDEAVEKIGADAMRWMYARQNPVENLKFGYNAANEIKRKLLTLYNSIDFFTIYVSDEEYSKEEKIPETKNILDLWIISRLNNLIEKATKRLDDFNAASATLAIEDFFINDLSLWYIRRSRRRFQKPRSQGEKKEAIETLYYVIFNLIKLIAPIMPFWAEENYQKVRGKEMPESVHLLDWPCSDKKLINQELEKEMDEVRKIVALVLTERSWAGIKVRQPLSRLKIKDLRFKFGKELLELIKEEINVKEIVFDEKIKKEVELDTEITLELKEEGMVKEIIRQIQDLRKKAGFIPQNRPKIYFSGDSQLEEILTRNKETILKETNSQTLEFCSNWKDFKDQPKEIIIEDKKLYLGFLKNI